MSAKTLATIVRPAASRLMNTTRYFSTKVAHEAKQTPSRSFANAAKQESSESMIPPMTKMSFSSNNVFNKGEVVVVKQVEGNLALGRVETIFLPGIRREPAEYVVCLDAENSVYMLEVGSMIGKITDA
mmetsp:Transcript_62926/g.168514  ORF Transcript_62926/g.168514 Transcript_62926/m.168514 type:complete len:128 (+) Transcript_62926:77-460(+)